jgi:hemin uptake protein HemP
MAVPADKERKASIRRISVAELLDGSREVVLLHDATEYRLRLTSNDQKFAPHITPSQPRKEASQVHSKA